MGFLRCIGLGLLASGCVAGPPGGGFGGMGTPGSGLGPSGPGGPSGAMRGPPRGGMGNVFISPMGEPFRGTEGRKALVGKWFAQVDRNGDGMIDPVEMQADAIRFFNTLDVDHDGQIDPSEMRRYETEIAPEVQAYVPMMGRGGPPAGGPEGGPGGGGMGRGGPGGPGGGGPDGGGPGGTSAGTSGTRSPSGTGRSGGEPLIGAARFGLLNIPQPVASADQSLNRSVTKEEFARASMRRLGMLDSNQDGRLKIDELPLPKQARAGSGRPPR